MKVRRFEATRVHGYLDLAVEFHSGITYLTGINGSGKTTVVNGISALISPSFAYLAETTFATMTVEIEHEGTVASISAERDGELLTLTSSLEQQSLAIPVLPTEGVSARAAQDREGEYYRELEARSSTHGVMKRLKALPTPMFLGLDRRSTSMFPGELHGPGALAWRRRSHNVFATSLVRSLGEAAGLAEQSYSKVQAQLRDLTDLLKKDFILSALQLASAQPSASFPSLDPRDIARTKATLAELGLTEDQIARNLDPFIERLRQVARYAPFSEDLQMVLQSEDKDKSDAYLEWFTNHSQYDRLTRLLAKVDKYVANSQGASADLTAYVDIVNGFLRDSGKTIKFDRTGDLVVSIAGGVGRPVQALSSGESQIVVILTHLAFNPAARKANVFIVDEPELSLHLRWQELFVVAIKTLNPELQTILATHSPAIILEDTVHCVDLSQSLPR